MARWTVQIGQDQILLDKVADTVVIEIDGRQVTATRTEVEDLRRKLGAALGYED